ncbi:MULTISPECIES: alpha-ketoglutarate-dependent dioxygenase AlkB [unclassified Beijerinckia]|uniref:alpha-ketoglutarate-dependent dioxygenase AlkB family protein n=1 Tax=unclassified Beijerinckia TaxID=2638183 RepID=UPI000897C17E|nr:MULTISPECIES: alpha-ketoglutarate-dependent dioxygenase AlkB [unclassified Beijerinckia]MDH7796629.1 alkylated DNA repair protein (DNA oxidative demethylase) [Beijerinckia sp. GAS462]SEC53274.1 DNA-N1-methyladenine dioxygenase [Beijerinckia sp. 28-YEA-48]
MPEIADGLHYFPGFYSRDEQIALVEQLRLCLRAAPLYTPHMPRTGKAFSVRMSNCGSLGWMSDVERGYRYEARHPVTGAPWPDIPDLVLKAWRETSAYPALPEACLINFYDGSARMGLHQDRDETAQDAPVVSISLGDSCLFRFGGTQRGGPTKSLKLHSGDVLVIGGASRFVFHGVDRILSGTSTLLADGGRINLTMRRVT